MVLPHDQLLLCTKSTHPNSGRKETNLLLWTADCRLPSALGEGESSGITRKAWLVLIQELGEHARLQLANFTAPSFRFESYMIE